MTDLAHKLHSAYERLHRASTDDLAERTRRINTAKVTQHAAVNDRHARSVAHIEEARQKAHKAIAELHLPQTRYAQKILDQKLALAQSEFEATMREAEHAKKLQCTNLQRRAVTLVQSTPELEAEQEEMLGIESRYDVAYEAAWAANQIAIAGAKAEYEARVFVDTFHENEVIAIDAQYNAELQQAMQSAKTAHDQIEERAQSQLKGANDELIKERRKRLSIWQDESLELEEKLLRLKALLN